MTNTIHLIPTNEIFITFQSVITRAATLSLKCTLGLRIRLDMTRSVVS